MRNKNRIECILRKIALGSQCIETGVTARFAFLAEPMDGFAKANSERCDGRDALLASSVPYSENKYILTE